MGRRNCLSAMEVFNCLGEVGQGAIRVTASHGGPPTRGVSQAAAGP